MEPTEPVLPVARDTVADALAAFLDYAPLLIAAIGVVVLGWLIARMVRGAARRLFSGANRLLDRVFKRGALSGTRLSTTVTTVLGEVAFWIIIFLAVTIAARIAKLPTISLWLNQIVVFIPSLLIGGLIILAGYFVSVFAGEQVSEAGRAAKASQSDLMGRLAQAAVFVTAIVIGLDQMGVDVTFLVALFAVAVGAIFVGFSIAFGLGARDHVSNLIGARTVRRDLPVGASVRIGEHEGEVLEVTPTQIALDTAQGRALVPARLAEESGVLVVAKDRQDGAVHG